MFTFNRKYFLLTILLFLIEVGNALYVRDSFVRPYLGDVLVVILIYCFVKSFVKLTVPIAALSVLLFAFSIETLQYFSIVEKLNLQDNKMVRTVIGTSFAWEDIIAYIVGMAVVVFCEYFFGKKKTLQ